MTSPQRRRVAAALARQPVDQVPIGELYVEDELVAALADLRPGSPPTFATRRAVLEDLHLDLVGAYPDLPDGTPLLGGHLAANRDTALRAARRAQRGIPLAAGGPDRGAARLGLPEPRELSWRPVQAWREESPLFTMAVLPGPFGELAYLVGIDQFLVLAWRRPDEARWLAEAMVDYALDLARVAQENGAEGFVIGEDVAWDRGLLLRETIYQSLFLPALRREVDGLGDLGAPVVFHSDGDITALLDDLVDVGVDGLHGLSPASGMDLRALATRVGSRMCLWGNLDLDVISAPSSTALAGPVRDTIQAGTTSPGYLFGTSAGVLDATLPPDRVRDTYHLAASLARAPFA